MNKENTFFSVIIPVYNVKDYFDDCMQSIFRQTYNDYEIVLIDDGSNDGSEKICDDYAAKYDNVVVYHKKNGGQSSARNMGTEVASGRYFIFVDSDDYISDNTLEMFYEKIQEYGELDVVLSEFMYAVEPSGKIIDAQGRLSAADYEGISGTEAINKMYHSIPDWSPCGKCYRLQYWRDKGFRFIEGRISEDLQLIDRVTLEAGKVAMVSAHYYYRWKIESSTMHKNFEKLVRDTIFVLDDWNSYLVSKNFDSELDTAIRSVMANMLEHTVMGNIYYVEKDKRQEFFTGVKGLLHFLSYDHSAEGRLTLAACRLIGVKCTCYLLNIVKTARKKKEASA